MAGAPLVRVHLDWCTRKATLHAWVRYPDGTWHGRVSYRELIGDGEQDVAFTLPAAAIIELPGEEYGDVPVEHVTPREQHGLWRYQRRAAG